MKLVHRAQRLHLDNARDTGQNLGGNSVTQINNNTTAIATTDGLTTGSLAVAPQFVTVTSSAASNIISLPPVASTRLGTEIWGVVGANGFKLQVNPADATTVTLNNVTTNVKAAIPANVSFYCYLISPTAWILSTVTALGAVGTAIVPA